MITIRICPNCGSTNDDVGPVCRKCGALLPVGNRPPRMRVPFNINAQTQPTPQPAPQPAPQRPTNVNPNPSVQFFSGNKKQEEPVNTQPAPPSQPATLQAPQVDTSHLNQQATGTVHKDNLSNIPAHLNAIPREGLQEIEPIPFRSTIIPQGGISSPQSPQGNLQSIPAPGGQLATQPVPQPSPQPAPQPAPKQPQASKESINRLEDEMSGLLSVLSSQIDVPKEKKAETKAKVQEEIVEKLPPSSMNDILKELLTLDNRIEASALIQDDGTILASAVTSSITDGLFSTIGRTLTLISTDILNGLGAGDLLSITIRGEYGLLNLAPIDVGHPNVKKMVLIMFSSAKVKSGIVNIAINLVKKQILDYLGISNGSK